MDKSEKNDKSAHIEHLLKSFDSHKEAYFETAQKVHDVLAHSISNSGSTSNHASRTVRPGLGSPHRQNSDTQAGAPSFLTRGTGEESDEEHESDELLYVQEPLASQSFTEDGLRQHLLNTPWDEYGWAILKDLLGNGAMSNFSHDRRHSLFPSRSGPVEDRSHLSGYQVWNIGPDGAPVAVEPVDENTSRAMTIWNALKDINPPEKRKAVGRITIVRELSPLLFGGLHYTLNETFDMDEIFKQIVAPGSSSAQMHRAFESDPRKRCTKFFTLEYFTIIGDDCKPMEWQLASKELDKNPKHIHITRCNAVVALAMTSAPVRKVRNPSRRASGSNIFGDVYDPWSAWHVLNLQCFPDLRSSTDVHDAAKHYVNDPEAFMITLLGEFRDAQRRLEDINRAITKLITPSSAFMFDSKYRDDLLFEDEHFTYVRRYFWAYQTLGIMNVSIRNIIDEFEHNFTEEVFEGTHKTLWPLADQTSARSVFYKKKMATLRRKFEAQMQAFRHLIQDNEDRRTEIRGLREELYVGTSIQESRKSVEATETTVQQGHNIKLLTLVSIFFLPSQFVTSVFGMTNMPDTQEYWTFGVVLVAVCVPFFILIGSLNSTRGMMFWQHRAHAAFVAMMKFFHLLGSCIRRKPKPEECDEKDEEKEPTPSERPRLRRSDLPKHDRPRRSWGLRSRGTMPTQVEEAHEDASQRASVDAEVEAPRIKRSSGSKFSDLIRGGSKQSTNLSEV